MYMTFGGFIPSGASSSMSPTIESSPVENAAATRSVFVTSTNASQTTTTMRHTSGPMSNKMRIINANAVYDRPAYISVQYLIFS